MDREIILYPGLILGKIHLIFTFQVSIIISIWNSSRTFGPSGLATIPRRWVLWAFYCYPPCLCSALICAYTCSLVSLTVAPLSLPLHLGPPSLSHGGGGGVDAAGSGGAAGHPGSGLRWGRWGLPPPGRARRQFRARFSPGKVNRTLKNFGTVVA